MAARPVLLSLVKLVFQTPCPGFLRAVLSQIEGHKAHDFEKRLEVQNQSIQTLPTPTMAKVDLQTTGVC